MKNLNEHLGLLIYKALVKLKLRIATVYAVISLFVTLRKAKQLGWLQSVYP